MTKLHAMTKGKVLVKINPSHVQKLSQRCLEIINFEMWQARIIWSSYELMHFYRLFFDDDSHTIMNNLKVFKYMLSVNFIQ